jgi:PTS system nitrogen regulatory IIA component
MYLNVVELAESFGVDESVVEGWVRHEDLPCVADRGRLLFDRAQVVAWAARRGLAARAGFLSPARAAPARSPQLESLLRAGGIWRSVAAADVLNILERVIAALPNANPAVRQLLVQRLRAPGGVTWAPVGGGLALPHLRTPVALGRDAGTLALLLLRDSLPLSDPAPDDQPIARLLFFIAPSPRVHLELLGKLSGALTRGRLRQLVLDAASDEQIFAALAGAENKPHQEAVE